MPLIIRKVPISTRQAYERLVQEAAVVGLQVTLADPEERYLSMRIPGSRDSARLSVSVTDSGFDYSIVHVQWEPASMAAARRARRMLRGVGAGA